MDKLHLLKKLEQLLWNRLLPILLLLTTFAVANPGKPQTAEENSEKKDKKA